MFFEDCVASSESSIQLNQTLNFLFLSIFGEVVLFCKKVNLRLIQNMKCSLNLSIFEQKFLLGLKGL